MRTTHIIFQIAKREVFRIATRPLYLFCMVIAPLFCYIFFTTLMWNGLPTDMPAGVVDLDNTATTRNIIRNLDAFQQTKIVAHYAGFADARKAMQEGKIYAFYFIPEGTTAKALASRQPKVSFYTNYSYLVAGSLLYKDQRTMSELASGAIGRATLRAKGATDDQAVAFLQPIVIDSHILNNPWLNYSVYLSNTIIPGILMLLIFMTTIYTIGSEIKGNTQKEWMQMADNSVTLALSGKLLPQTLIFFIMATFYNVYLYGFLHQRYPPHALGRTVAGIGITSLWHFLVRTVHHHAACFKHSFAMGSHFLLHFRNELSRHGYESCVAGISLSVSVTALLPHLRQPGTQRLSLDLCMAFGSSIDAFHAIAFLHTEKASHRAIALCIYPLKN